MFAFVRCGPEDTSALVREIRHQLHYDGLCAGAEAILDHWMLSVEDALNDFSLAGISPRL